jgi:hypothetical protein
MNIDIIMRQPVSVWRSTHGGAHHYFRSRHPNANADCRDAIYYWRLPFAAPSSTSPRAVILAPGSRPPPGVKVTEHSTMMGVFCIVSSPADCAFVISVCDVRTRGVPFQVTRLTCHSGE